MMGIKDSAPGSCPTHPQEKLIKGKRGYTYCKVCHREYQAKKRATTEGHQHALELGRKYEEKRRGKRTAYSHMSHLRLRYNITPEQRKDMGYACAICGEYGRDVDHVKGSDPPIVRGVLCSACNTGIGKFYHDPERLRAAAAYLENPCAYIGGIAC